MSTSSPPFPAFEASERFDILSLVGSGGMGTVYEAFDRERKTRVALKVLAADDDPRALLLFKNEFRSLQDLDHRNLVSMGELFAERGQWFFTMEMVRGANF